jgi:uncharacterized protein (TIGR00369 family)
MKFFSDEQVVCSWLTMPEHVAGWNNVVHGGITSTILDEIMSWAGLYLLQQVTLTKNMTIEFIMALNVGDKIRAQGKVLEYDGKHNATIQGLIFNNQEKICARAIGNFNILSFKIAKRLGVVTDSHVKDYFEPLIRHKSG